MSFKLPSTHYTELAASDPNTDLRQCDPFENDKNKTGAPIARGAREL